MRLSIYCSGSIKKGDGDQTGTLWGHDERQAVRAGACADVVWLRPDDPIPVPGNVLGQFGRDMYQVLMATAVVVDARDRRGIGVGVEVASAGIIGTPVIVVAPPNSEYRRDTLTYRGATVDNYVHPHLAVIAHAIVDDFTAAGKELPGLVGELTQATGWPRWLADSIREYEENVLPHDPPMLRALDELRA